MFPPYRNVAFNPSLTMNDGLLAQSYMQARGVAYGEASRLISEAVARLEAELRGTGKYELPGIGVLSVNAAGSTEFCPNAAGVLAPEFYGLDAFALEPVDAVEGGGNGTAGETVGSSSARHYTLRVHKELVHYVAAAVMAVVFYTICVVPSGLAPAESGPQRAEMGLPGEKTAPVPAVVRGKSAEKPVLADAVPDADAVALPAGKEKPADEVREAAPTSRPGYTIVLASQVAERNAEAFVESFVRAGYEDVRVYERGRMRRVVFGTFSTESEAHERLRSLRDDERFEDGWVMALR